MAGETDERQRKAGPQAHGAAKVIFCSPPALPPSVPSLILFCSSSAPALIPSLNCALSGRSCSLKPWNPTRIPTIPSDCALVNRLQNGFNHGTPHVVGLRFATSAPTAPAPVPRPKEKNIPGRSRAKLIRRGKKKVYHVCKEAACLGKHHEATRHPSVFSASY